MKLHHYVLFLTIICLPACTWVELTPAGSSVTLVKAFNVKSCKKVGTTTATVTNKVGVVARSEDKVTEELTTLAKNRAATMGGDSIVAQPPVVDGSMSFEVYKCAE